MKSTIHRSAIAAASLSLALSACGGGGSSTSTTGAAAPASGASATPATPASGASSTPAASAAITLLPAPGASASAFAPSGDVVNDSLGYLNDKRAQLGLPAFAFQAAVAQAATNHAVYVQENNSPGHYETAGLPGYTGVSPSDRVNALYPTAAVSEIVAGVTGPFTSSIEPIDMLFDAPFHRSITLFDSVFAGPGVALTTDPTKFSVLNVDFADYKQFVPDNELIAYPYPGQANAKTSWVANESPNPFASAPQYIDQSVGYPITLDGAGNAAFSSIAFTITDPTGASVPCLEADNTNNAEAVRLAMCVPYAPLAASTVYSVKVTGSLTNTTIPSPQAFSVAWSFTTAASPATAKAAAGAAGAKGSTRKVFVN
jgi:uncharacterized protein YkwD